MRSLTLMYEASKVRIRTSSLSSPVSNLSYIEVFDVWGRARLDAKKCIIYILYLIHPYGGEVYFYPPSYPLPYPSHTTHIHTLYQFYAKIRKSYEKFFGGDGVAIGSPKGKVLATFEKCCSKYSGRGRWYAVCDVDFMSPLEKLWMTISSAAQHFVIDRSLIEEAVFRFIVEMCLKIEEAPMWCHIESGTEDEWLDCIPDYLLG